MKLRLSTIEDRGSEKHENEKELMVHESERTTMLIKPSMRVSPKSALEVYKFDVKQFKHAPPATRDSQQQV
jgi:hypothetical protein